MNFYPLFINRQIGQPRIHPPARVVVMNPVLLHMNASCVCPQKIAVCALMPRVVQRPRGHFRRHAQPARIQPVNQPRNRLALKIQLLQQQIQRRSPPAQPDPVHLKSVELVTVNRNVPQPAIVPAVILVHPNPHQVRHDVGQPVIVIALHPDHFNVALGIRELPDIGPETSSVLWSDGQN
jgi:hypothetical protein